MLSTSPGATRLPIIKVEHDAVATKTAAESHAGKKRNDNGDYGDDRRELDRAVK